MKNLKITHILALCLSFVPIALECSGASSSVATAVASAAQVQKTGYYNMEEGSAGYLYIKEASDGYIYKYYLPSTTLGRWKTWSKKNQALRGAERVEADQRFEFYIDPGMGMNSGLGFPKVYVPYFKLKVSVNGYGIENVEIVPVEGVSVTDQDLENQYKLANLKMNMLQLCIQYSAFADQLQYNGTILARGILPSQVRQNVYDGALSPMIRALQSSALQPRIAETMRSIVEPYMNAYADEYNSANIGKRLKKYLAQNVTGENLETLGDTISIKLRPDSQSESIDFLDPFSFMLEGGYNVSALYAALVPGAYNLNVQNMKPGTILPRHAWIVPIDRFTSNGTGTLSLIQEPGSRLIPVRMISGKLIGYVGTTDRLRSQNGEATVEQILNAPNREPQKYTPIDSFSTLPRGTFLVPNVVDGVTTSFTCIISPTND